MNVNIAKNFAPGRDSLGHS